MRWKYTFSYTVGLNGVGWCILREFHTKALFKNVSTPSFHFSLDFVGNGQ